jgi:threonine/homoserine/homoserine lactone efflux protein
MLELILPLIIFLFPLAYSPGPGNLFFAANAAAFGFLETMRSMIGYHVATFIAVILIGFGFEDIINQFPKAFKTIQFLGSCYVVYLAFKLVTSAPIKNEYSAHTPRFRDGVLLLALNPKAYVIMGLMFSQFSSDRGLDTVQVFLISITFTMNNFIAFCVWGLAGDSLTKLFKTQESARRINLIFGLILICVALWMLF